MNEHTNIPETPTHPVSPHLTMQQASSAAIKPHRSLQGFVLAERITYIGGGVLQMFLAFRFILSLLAANRDNQFADLVFGVSAPFVAPFLDLFNYQTAYGASRFELETLVAMAVYALLGVLLVAVFRLPRHTAGA